MGFPEIFILVALIGGMCYGVSEYQVPLVVYGILLANGKFVYLVCLLYSSSGPYLTLIPSLPPSPQV
ncbi:hypothetical protein EON65_13110 [archaeon]|nr:MAG: hypothetical protein EON65_13110 [archaeon]